MPKLIDLSSFDFSFFLSGRTEVNSLIEGARTYGGATKFSECIYSNIEEGQMVEISDNNEISIYIPSTININETINDREFVRYAMESINMYYKNADVSIFDSEGSWFDESINDVVIENITIVTLKRNDINSTDIRFFRLLAQDIKDKMKQSGVSIQINSALAIV